MFTNNINTLIKNKVTEYVYSNENKMTEEIKNKIKELEELREKPEIDYEKASDLLFKLINQLISKFKIEFDNEQVKNIVMMYKKELANEIYNQMSKHFVRNEGKNYEPDFVVETEKMTYLVEVKGEDKLDDPDVLAKKKKSIEYCKLVSKWAEETGNKKWTHVFIPASKISSKSTFRYLSEYYAVK